MFERLFQIRARGSSIPREIIGGVITFMTMAYIISLQPFLMRQHAPNWVVSDEIYFSLMVATCLISALSCFFIAFSANYPVALAPGMGLNMMFVLMIGGALATTPAIALGVIFWSGILFFLLSFFRLREFILEMIKPSQQAAIVVGIGLFILAIGVMNVFKIPGSYNLLKWEFFFLWDNTVFLVFIINLALVSILMFLRVPGALFIGMICGAVVTGLFGLVAVEDFVSLPPSIAPTLLQIDFLGALQVTMLPYIAIFLFADMFETMATLIGVTRKAKLVKEDGSIPRANGALKADAFGTLGGSLMGISPVTCYIESSAGVVSGARTGLTAVVVGALFLLATFFTPMWSYLASNVIVGPVLVIVGVLMISEIGKIDWKDWSEAVPATLTMGAMVALFSITWGLALGFISYPLCKLLKGDRGKLNWLHWLMALISLILLIMIFAKF